MGKVDDYMAGRTDGLQLAYDIVQKGGIDALKEELRFRGITKINTPMNKKDLELGTRKIKEMTCDTIMSLSVLTIHDEFGFGKKRCERFMARFNLKADCLMDDMCKWKDVIDVVKEEMGIDLTIRRND